jgi:hypothetical protein
MISIGPLSAWEVSNRLGVHINTVKRIPPSELPFFRVGHRGDRRYLLESVEEYIRRRSVWA